MYLPPKGRVDRVELFARGELPIWWHGWGAEYGGSDEIMAWADELGRQGTADMEEAEQLAASDGPPYDPNPAISRPS